MRLSLYLLLTLFSSQLIAQNRTQSFELDLHHKKVTGSLYNKIVFIDQRPDTSSFGEIQKGAFNSKNVLVAEKPLQKQLSELIAYAADNNAADGEMLFLLRKFKLTETTLSTNETGKCYFRANLFSREENSYRKIASIDTVIEIRAFDVTKRLLKTGSTAITDFILASLQSSGAEEIYIYDAVMHLDSIEKREIPLYNTDHFTDGVYLNYWSFKNQQPDYEVKATVKNEKISRIKKINRRGKLEPIDPTRTYAVIVQGVPYVSTDLGFCPLTKQNDDFYFEATIQGSANTGAVVAGGILFGAIGGAVAGAIAASNIKDYEMKIDHISGRFIRLREL